ncbi:hypothetical protein ACVW1B_004315 [Bradyrhizobium sp. USDA 4502]
MEARQYLGDLGIDVAPRSHPSPPVAAAPHPFGDRKPDGFERGQVGIELVDLERARQPAQHPLVDGKAGDVAAFEQDAPAVRR